MLHRPDAHFHHRGSAARAASTAIAATTRPTAHQRYRCSAARSTHAGAAAATRAACTAEAATTRPGHPPSCPIPPPWQRRPFISHRCRSHHLPSRPRKPPRQPLPVQLGPPRQLPAAQATRLAAPVHHRGDGASASRTAVAATARQAMPAKPPTKTTAAAVACAAGTAAAAASRPGHPRSCPPPRTLKWRPFISHALPRQPLRAPPPTDTTVPAAHS